MAEKSWLNDPKEAEHIVLVNTALTEECRNCQRELGVDWQFCAHCGTRLATVCPECGVPLPPAGAQRCGHCGMELPHPRP